MTNNDVIAGTIMVMLLLMYWLAVRARKLEDRVAKLEAKDKP